MLIDIFKIWPKGGYVPLTVLLTYLTVLLTYLTVLLTYLTCIAAVTSATVQI